MPQDWLEQQVDIEKMERDRDTRNQIIEECGQVLDGFASVQSNPDFQAMYEDAAAAIRALKDKP